MRQYRLAVEELKEHNRVGPVRENVGEEAHNIRAGCGQVVKFVCQDIDKYFDEQANFSLDAEE